MAWVDPQYTVQQVNAAGKGFLKFATSSDGEMDDYFAYETALSVINNWRASHGYPNYFADTRIFVELLKQALSGSRRRVITRQLSLFDMPTGERGGK